MSYRSLGSDEVALRNYRPVDPTLEIGSKFVTDHKPVSGYAFELRGKLPENTTRRCAAENSDLGGLRRAALLRQSQCDNGSSYCRGRPCLNTVPHCEFPNIAHSLTLRLVIPSRSPTTTRTSAAADSTTIPSSTCARGSTRSIVRHTSPLLNALLARMLLEPTHTDPILRRFPNYNEVWARE
jgi:hypothetical protein